MTADEFVRTILLNLPNFAGLIFAVWVLKLQNDRLIALVERLTERSADIESAKK